MKITFVVVIFCGCKKNESVDYEDNSFLEIFDEFWFRLNQSYLYWDIDPTDWDEQYDRYRPLFGKLTKNVADKRKAKEYFREMTDSLIDGHFSINFKDSDLVGEAIVPVFERKADKIHTRFDYFNVVKKYIASEYEYGEEQNFYSYPYVKIQTGLIKPDILYLGFNRFVLTKAVNAAAANQIKSTFEKYRHLLTGKTSAVKSVVIDVRGNQGGDLLDLNFLLENFIRNNQLIGYTRNKTGIDKSAYSPWMEATIKAKQNFILLNHIIVLTDNYSASMAETLSLAVSQMENGSLVGEQTWGATGPIGDPDLFLGGSFSVSDFMNVNCSSVAFKTIKGQVLEGTGISPDMMVPFDEISLNRGTDKQLEAAISYIAGDK